MSVLALTPDDGFDPEAVDLLASVLEKVCAELGLSPRSDRLTEVVARHVIDAAKSGLRNASAIRLHVMEQFAADQ